MKKRKKKRKNGEGRIIANGEKRKIRIFHCGCKMSSRAIRGVHGRTIARGSISAYTRKRETNMKVGVTVRVLEDAEEEEEEKGDRREEEEKREVALNPIALCRGDHWHLLINNKCIPE